MFNPQPKKGLKKKKRMKSIEPDPDYLSYIRTMMCCVPICSQYAEPHHESSVSSTPSMGLKCSDYFAVPLCREHHDKLGSLGVKTFYSMYSMDIKKIIIILLKSYIKELKSKRRGL